MCPHRLNFSRCSHLKCSVVVLFDFNKFHWKSFHLNQYALIANECSTEDVKLAMFSMNLFACCAYALRYMIHELKLILYRLYVFSAVVVIITYAFGKVNLEAMERHDNNAERSVMLRNYWNQRLFYRRYFFGTLVVV